ncbi:ribosome maturation factor RimP [Streptomyces radicis]|uniref:Ribosome maturation factor RimP n=1 Tax=Streptomyces radicis TaxID=1750517 RepID=A0A3A9WG80_9ACTN|nr:ribosome maturation factor RimP [Streptomyces radicis]RKN06706.1 ribosome maturation factor RimP [Streptomyces radicis]RKN19332.1 ribosome maturation factor RimP [Streptomyces radicis]
MSTTQIDRLRELLEPLAAKRGMNLEDVKITPAGRRRVLQIVVDTDEGVGLDACAELSRAASEALDEGDLMGGAPYVLEVTSPGAERPLTEPRHYLRSVGRLVRLRLTGGGELAARLVAVDDTGLDLEIPGEKGRKGTARRVDLADVASARVEVEFSRRPAGDESTKEA